MQISRLENPPTYLSSHENISNEDFTLKHLLCFEICAREICKKFVYKHLETTEYVKN